MIKEAGFGMINYIQLAIKWTKGDTMATQWIFLKLFVDALWAEKGC